MYSRRKEKIKPLLSPNPAETKAPPSGVPTTEKADLDLPIVLSEKLRII